MPVVALFVVKLAAQPASAVSTLAGKIPLFSKLARGLDPLKVRKVLAAVATALIVIEVGELIAVIVALAGMPVPATVMPTAKSAVFETVTMLEAVVVAVRFAAKFKFVGRTRTASVLPAPPSVLVPGEITRVPTASRFNVVGANWLLKPGALCRSM